MAINFAIEELMCLEIHQLKNFISLTDFFIYESVLINNYFVNQFIEV